LVTGTQNLKGDEEEEQEFSAIPSLTRVSAPYFIISLISYEYLPLITLFWS